MQHSEYITVCLAIKHMTDNIPGQHMTISEWCLQVYSTELCYEGLSYCGQTGVLSGLFLSCFLANVLRAFLVSSMHTCSTHIIPLDFITLIPSGEQHQKINCRKMYKHIWILEANIKTRIRNWEKNKRGKIFIIFCLRIIPTLFFVIVHGSIQPLPHTSLQHSA
jgi:hypothetical protein